MADFATIQKQLSAAREQKAQALAALQKVNFANANAIRARTSGLDGDALLREKRRAMDRLEAARADEAKAHADFDTASDPRRHLDQLSANTPILLFPLRLETRFRNSGATHELLVRVYPDSCLLDSFEPEFTAEELGSVQAYWVEVWRGGEGSSLHRAAWAVLAGKFGIGRARWLVTSYRPENSSEQPSSDGKSRLVIPVPSKTDKDNRAALSAFWLSVSAADGNQKAEVEAQRELIAAVGDEQAELLSNFSQRVKTQISSKVDEAVVLVFPEDPPMKPAGWTQAARVDPLPDRFVLRLMQNGNRREILGRLITKPLYGSVNPLGSNGAPSPPNAAGTINFPDELLWMTDFDVALQAGMAFKVTLTATEATDGFDRLTVVGVNLAQTAQDGSKAVADLVESRLYTANGFEIVPQGTPTNNTDDSRSGVTSAERVDQAFAAIRGSGLYAASNDPMQTADGQYLAAALGVDDQVIARLINSDGKDQLLARAMNVALWEGTLGYYLQSLLDPVFGRKIINQARRHFITHVSGRGRVPAVRIGRQPYGILPIMAMQSTNWIDTAQDEEQRNFLLQLQKLLVALEGHWRDLATGVDHIGSSTDPNHTLLRVLGLNATSTEFHSRLAESVKHVVARFRAIGIETGEAEFIDVFHRDGRTLLAELGYSGLDVPDILRMVFHDENSVLDGGIAYSLPPQSGFENELEEFCIWLIKAMQRSIEEVKDLQNAPGGSAPRALLPLLLHYAALHSYRTTAINLHVGDEVTPAALTISSARETPFPHITARVDPKGPVESPWQKLLLPNAKITSDAAMSVADFITKNLHLNHSAFSNLQEVLAALKVISRAHTDSAALAFCEHVDCCSYRLDAWFLSFAHTRLSDLSAKREGTHTGAYGWLENIRPKAVGLRPVLLDKGKAALLDPKGTLPPLQEDPANGGHILAPSLNHAVTAAVLRSGYQNAETDQQRQAIGVNLSSERVRSALFLKEGMRNGQRLAALLGYQFERGLQNLKPTLQTDLHIDAFRKAFPYVAGKLVDTVNDPNDVAIEARGTVDGVALLEHTQKPGNGSYPFGLTLPNASSALVQGITKEIDRLRDSQDALGDCSLAEAVHQSVLGNYDRVAAAVEAYAKGAVPPEPDVIKSASTGITLTHRVGCVLSNTAPLVRTPRALAEPALAAWLEKMLPQPTLLGCTVSWKDSAAQSQSDTVNVQSLGTSYLDLLCMYQAGDRQSFSGLDDLILGKLYSRTSNPLPLCAAPTINYMQAPTNGLSFFEVGTLLDGFAKLCTTSRSMLPSDMLPSNQASATLDATAFINSSRIDVPLAELAQLIAKFSASIVALQSGLANTANSFQATLDTIDADLRRVAALHVEARNYVDNIGYMETILIAPQQLLTKLREALTVIIERFEFRLAVALEDLDKSDALTDERAVDALHGVEAHVSTSRSGETQTGDLRAAVVVKITAFQNRLVQFKNLAGNQPALLLQFLQNFEAIADLSAFEYESSDVPALRKLLPTIAEALVSLCQSTLSRLQNIDRDTTLLRSEYLALPSGTGRNKKMEQAAKTLFGEAFHLIPEFTLADAHTNQLAKALSTSRSGDTLSYLTKTIEMDFPVDEWLYGVARVRKPMQTIESITMLADSLQLSGPVLEPLQLPYRDDDRWLGLDYPEDYDIDGERLLLTLHVEQEFIASTVYRGLVLDAWTEVVPGQRLDKTVDAVDIHTQTAGLAFHFDRPNAEAPQSWLLALPSSNDGTWSWKDLMNAMDWTWEAAQQRAVEPEHIDASQLKRFLPATVMAAAARDVTISAILGRNINIEKFLQA